MDVPRRHRAGIQGSRRFQFRGRSGQVRAVLPRGTRLKRRDLVVDDCQVRTRHKSLSGDLRPAVRWLAETRDERWQKVLLGDSKVPRGERSGRRLVSLAPPRARQRISRFPAIPGPARLAGPTTCTNYSQSKSSFTIRGKTSRGAGLPTPPGSDRGCRGNAKGETCGRAFRRGRETRRPGARLFPVSGAQVVEYAPKPLYAGEY